MLLPQLRTTLARPPQAVSRPSVTVPWRTQRRRRFGRTADSGLSRGTRPQRRAVVLRAMCRVVLFFFLQFYFHFKTSTAIVRFFIAYRYFSRVYALNLFRVTPPKYCRGINDLLSDNDPSVHAVHNVSRCVSYILSRGCLRDENSHRAYRIQIVSIRMPRRYR